METCARKDLTCGESIKIPAGSVKKKTRYCMCVCEGKRSTPLKDLARLSDSPPQLLLRTSAHTGIRTAFCCRCSSQPPMYGGKRERERRERRERGGGPLTRKGPHRHTHQHLGTNRCSSFSPLNIFSNWRYF